MGVDKSVARPMREGQTSAGAGGLVASAAAGAQVASSTSVEESAARCTTASRPTRSVVRLLRLSRIVGCATEVTAGAAPQKVPRLGVAAWRPNGRRNRGRRRPLDRLWNRSTPRHPRRELVWQRSNRVPPLRPSSNCVEDGVKVERLRPTGYPDTRHPMTTIGQKPYPFARRAFVVQELTRHTLGASSVDEAISLVYEPADCLCDVCRWPIGQDLFPETSDRTGLALGRTPCSSQGQPEATPQG